MSERIWEERGLRDAVLAGDETAWQALYDRCFASLFRYVHWRCGGQMQMTEEVVQEVWLVAVRRIRGFQPERASFLSWLRGIADKVLLNQRRKQARRRGREAQALEDAAAARDDGVCHRAEALADAEEVVLALGQLPDRYQAVLRAKYAEQQSVADIAAQWQSSAKAVESLLSRARDAFRKAYAQVKE